MDELRRGSRLTDEVAHMGIRGDVNECGRPSRPCSHSCMNTPGSFRCYCDPGYRLDTDGKSCKRLEKPDCTRLHCQLGCQISSNGASICSCPPGLQLALDKRTCKDVDECKGAFSVCPEQQTCRNTFGSYACACRSGYILGILGNAITCRDEDECLTGRHRCSRHARCVNADGSYTCRRAYLSKTWWKTRVYPVLSSRKGSIWPFPNKTQE
ncbi:hypothetical protein KOW79_002138 [Hemibagrus wyckioides]|uniref:EGF-like domain-containing protein n=1 Tax=Hemibagrus wyckioides TaxID=337641 RepID=A0A9D3P355_9TELE|nr:hypothetical protein KOW79_002138 [Hemibagrus wyckioides]